MKLTPTQVGSIGGALRALLAVVERADVSEGVCCCGDNMRDHQPYDHIPTDAGVYAADQAKLAGLLALAMLEVGA